MMTGSFKSAIMFIISGILLLVEAGVSMIAYDDAIGAFIAGCIAFMMFITAGMAKSGGMSAIYRTVGEYEIGGGTVVIQEDTGQRVQCTPCAGIILGIATIVVSYLFAEPLMESAGFEEALLAVIFSMVAGVAAIVASVFFVVDYKGEYTA